MRHPDTQSRHGICLAVFVAAASAMAPLPSAAQSALGSASPRDLTAASSGTTVFVANPVNGQSKLYRTDGSSGGAVEIGSFTVADDVPSPSHITVAAGGGRVYFSANDGGGSGTELWVTDTTAGSTRLVTDLRSGPASSYPQELVALPSGELVFSAVTDGNGRELWASDGRSVRSLGDLWPGPDSSDPCELICVGSQVYFSADDGQAGRELWRTDGSSAGTQRVLDIRPGPSSSTPNALFAWQNQLWFCAHDGVHGFELWRSDGTAAGTALVADLQPGASSGQPGEFVDAIGRLWFVATNGQGPAARLFSTDGTTANTRAFGLGALGPMSPSNLTHAAGRLWFVAEDAAHGAELWSSDGSLAGTSVVEDIHPGAAASSPDQIVELNATDIVFVANDGTHGRELWRADASGAALVREIWSGSTSGRIAGMRRVNGQVLFGAQAEDGEGNELFVTDGSAGGTRRLENLNTDTEQLTLELTHSVDANGTQDFNFVVPASDLVIVLFAQRPGPAIDLNDYGYPSYGLIGIDLSTVYFGMAAWSARGEANIGFQLPGFLDVALSAQALTLNSPIRVSTVNNIRSGSWDMSQCPGCVSLPLSDSKAIFIDDTYEYDLAFRLQPTNEEAWLRVYRVSADGNEEQVQIQAIRPGQTRVRGQIELRRRERLELRLYCGDPANPCWVSKQLGC